MQFATATHLTVKSSGPAYSSRGNCVVPLRITEAHLCCIKNLNMSETPPLSIIRNINLTLRMRVLENDGEGET